MAKQNPEVMLAEDLAGFYADPLGFVMYAFPWDTDKSLQLVELAGNLRLIGPQAIAAWVEGSSTMKRSTGERPVR